MWNYTKTPSSDELMHWATGQTAPKHKWIERIKTSKGYRYIYNHSAIAQVKSYMDSQEKYATAVRRLNNSTFNAEIANENAADKSNAMRNNWKGRLQSESRVAANYAQEARKQKANMEVAMIRYNKTFAGKLMNFIKSQTSVTITTSSNLYPEKKISVKLH